MKTTTPIKKKVMIIDDNPGILFVMQQALDLKEYDVHIAETFAGVDAVHKIAPDLIFLDISLVGQDGRAVTKELKSSEKTKNIPVIILTAYPNADELTKEAGANDYLPKPFELEQLWKITSKYTSAS